MPIRSLDFEYELPPDRIAQRPRPYGEQKMLIYHRDSGHIDHSYFHRLPKILSTGDVLAINNSRVVPAQLRRSDGIFILLMYPQRQEFDNVYAICPSQPKAGEVLHLPGCRYVVKHEEATWDVRVGDLITEQPWDTLQEFMYAYGSHPIPTYVKRAPDEEDINDFQTSFASEAGSIAAPTAGLHFHESLLATLRERGVIVVQLTLHVGYGTFRRFKGEFVHDHTMDGEEFRVSAESACALWAARREGRRIIAVGTTTTRVLESISTQLDADQEPSSIEGITRLFIYPPYTFQVISGLVTNFHYPRTPVMSLTAAFCGGLDVLKGIYESALKSDYLFYSYGDGMLVI